MKKILAIILSMVMVLSSAVIITSAQDVNKIVPSLQKILENKESEEFVDVYIRTTSYYPNATEMPSWPDISAARDELKEYYDNWYKTEIAPVVFEGVEYKEIFIGSGMIIVSVKAGDIEKIASYDIIKDIDYFENGELENESAGVFEEAYRNYYSASEYFYNELYYHFNEKQELDWVLVNAYLYLSSPLGIKMDIGNIVLYSEEIYSDFRYKYGVYDVVEGKFYDLFDLRSEPEKFDELLEVLAELKIGRLIGDLDGDGDISILDATAIQRCLAGLDDYPSDEYYSVYDTDDCGRMSDFDRDGDVSILDVTAIQRKLAQYDL